MTLDNGMTDGRKRPGRRLKIATRVSLLNEPSSPDVELEPIYFKSLPDFLDLNIDENNIPSVSVQWEETGGGGTPRVKVPGVSLYDFYRDPLKFHKDDDDHDTVVNVRDLKDEMKCAVCLEIINDSRTVMECMHRFCASCISKALRTGKKECPTCRVKCSSQRHLRPDPNFDKLTKQLLPDRDSFEREEQDLAQETISQNFGIDGMNEDFLKANSRLSRKRKIPARYSSRKRSRSSDEADDDDDESDDEDLFGSGSLRLTDPSVSEHPTLKRASRSVASNSNNSSPSHPAPSILPVYTPAPFVAAQIYYYKHLSKMGTECSPEPEPSLDVYLSISPAPEEDKLPVLPLPFFKVSRSMPLQLLQAFIKSRCKRDVELLIEDLNGHSTSNAQTRCGPQFAVLDQQQNIEEAVLSRWNSSRDVVLFFRAV